MKKITTIFLIILFPLYLSCSGGNSQENEDPKSMNRIIPPDSSLEIDFTTLQETNKSLLAKEKCGPVNPNEGECFKKAMALVWWSNMVCFVPLTVPIIIYKILKTQIPAEISTEHVIWNYTYTREDVVYTISVTADYITADQKWEWSFKINDFVWITGISKDDLSGGNWQFYDYLTHAATIAVEWTRTSEINGTLKFINNESQSLKYGDFILYAREGNDISVLFHDVHCNFDDSGGLLETEVYWNIFDKTGGIDVIEDSTGTYQSCSWDFK